MSERYYPRVEIETRYEEGRPVTGHRQSVYIDGKSWPTRAYKIEAEVNGVQEITLTFLGHLTMTDVEEQPE